MTSRIKFELLTLMMMGVDAGCAPTNVQQQQNMTATQLPGPDLVLVYDFAVSPEEVKLDNRMKGA
jgi:hypothetical protein